MIITTRIYGPSVYTYIGSHEGYYTCFAFGHISEYEAHVRAAELTFRLRKHLPDTTPIVCATYVLPPACNHDYVHHIEMAEEHDEPT